jgi:hypothetical protein
VIGAVVNTTLLPESLKSTISPSDRRRHTSSLFTMSTPSIG